MCKGNLLVLIINNIIFEEKSFKRIHTKTYLLGWEGMVLKYFSYILNTKMTILAKIKPFIY